jgi:hypothetical protein
MNQGQAGNHAKKRVDLNSTRSGAAISHVSHGRIIFSTNIRPASSASRTRPDNSAFLLEKKENKRNIAVEIK